MFPPYLILLSAISNSLTLTGNKTDFEDLKNKDGKFDKNHVYTFSASDIAKHPETELTSDGLILIGLLSGGDYDQASLPCSCFLDHDLIEGFRLA
jgi:holliday junction resolvase YEN1